MYRCVYVAHFFFFRKAFLPRCSLFASPARELGSISFLFFLTDRLAFDLFTRHALSYATIATIITTVCRSSPRRSCSKKRKATTAWKLRVFDRTISLTARMVKTAVFSMVASHCFSLFVMDRVMLFSGSEVLSLCSSQCRSYRWCTFTYTQAHTSLRILGVARSITVLKKEESKK
jgi:hypothetical protein